MPLFNHYFAEGTLERLIANHVAWQAVLWVLDVTHPVSRRYVGAAVLLVTGADQHGNLLTVALLESQKVDDTYEIYSARYLDADEITPLIIPPTTQEDR